MQTLPRSSDLAVLVLGASGATGRLLVRELVSRDCPVKAVVRDATGLPDESRQSDLVEIVEASVLDLKLADWQGMNRGARTGRCRLNSYINSRNFAMRCSVFGWVEKSPAMLSADKGLTMNIWFMASS